MNEKELLEIEIDYTTDIRHIKLVAEVRRLKEEVEKRTDKICDDQLSLEGKESKIISLQQESQLYKDLYTKANTQNKVYKMALKENIPILKSVLQVIKNQVEYDEGITLGGVIVQLEKSLEVDTNE